MNYLKFSKITSMYEVKIFWIFIFKSFYFCFKWNNMFVVFCNKKIVLETFFIEDDWERSCFKFSI